MFNPSKDPPKKSRFQVTPRIDIETGASLDLNTSGLSSSSSVSNNQDANYNTTTSTTPLTAAVDDDSPDYSAYFSSQFFSNLDDNGGGHGGSGGLGNGLGHQNTTTTTSTSSYGSSFYNTIYKYNKLKQNGATDGSLDAVYFPFPPQRRRPSNSPHSVVGIPFYNERVLVYNFLQRPTGLLAISYHIFVSVAVVYCLVLTIMSTSSKFANQVSRWLNNIDYMIITFFVVEFLARLWASECVSYYRGWKGKIRFFKNPIRIIDLCVIVVSLAVLISNAKGELLITSLRGVRFIQIFQMVRLDFKFRPWRMMASVVYSQRIHLAIVFYMGFLALIFISFVIYFVEKDHNEDFESLASTMWWAVITLCTIGYGDMYPKTSTGKFLACVCSLVGVSIFALPAGILGTGLALKVQEQQRQLKISKRKQPAARLIQSAWRFYVSEQELKRSLAQSFHNLDHKESYNINYRSVLWKRFEANKNKSRTLTQKELNGVHFVFAVKLCIAKRDFVKAFKPYDIKDVLEQYAAGHADMLAKIRIMDHRLEKIQANSISSKTQHEIRLRFATHLTKLEYEMQKIQMNFNELLHYQVDSRLIIENLLKYLIDQQIALNRPGDPSPSSLASNGGGVCRLCPTNKVDTQCPMCSSIRQKTVNMLAQFQQTDLATKVNKTFSTYNENIMAHLRQMSFNNNQNNTATESKSSTSNHHHHHHYPVSYTSRRRKSM